MVWFKVDDHFHDHPKVVGLGNAACGLWVRCGAYVSSQATDGFIPGAIVARFGRGRDAKALTEAGLWEKVDGGYLMHDFLDYNPSSDQVKRDRAKTAARVAQWRDRHESNAVTNGVSNGVSNGAPDPTRPDPVLHNLPTDDSLGAAVRAAAVKACQVREVNGYGPAGPGAVKTAEAAIAAQADIIASWLERGARPHRIAEAAADRYLGTNPHALPWSPGEIPT